MKRTTSHQGASHNRAAAGERAEVLTRHVSADTECAIVRNVRANNESCGCTDFREARQCCTDASVQRYLAFKGDCYYPSKGMGDFVGDFAKLEDAIAALTADHKTQKAWSDDDRWATVWDSEIRADVWDNRMLPEA